MAEPHSYGPKAHTPDSKGAGLAALTPRPPLPTLRERGRRETVCESGALTPRDCGRGGDKLAHAEFVEPFVVDAEVVADFVEDGLSDLFADFVVG